MTSADPDEVLPSKPNPAPKTPSEAGTVPDKAEGKAFHRGSFDTIVDILVGPEKKPFKIYKQLLCDTSPYFEAALKGQFKEAQSQSIELVEENVIMFQFFQLWLYSGKILAPSESISDITWKTLFELYRFGEMRDIPGLQNAAIDILIDRSTKKSVIPSRFLADVYRDLLEDSPLRRLFIDWFSYDVVPEDGPWFSGSDPDKDTYPQDFLCDLLRSLYAIKARDKPQTLDIPSNRSKYYANTITASSNTGVTGR